MYHAHITKPMYVKLQNKTKPKRIFYDLSTIVTYQENATSKRRRPKISRNKERGPVHTCEIRIMNNGFDFILKSCNN